MPYDHHVTFYYRHNFLILLQSEAVPATKVQGGRSPPNPATNAPPDFFLPSVTKLRNCPIDITSLTETDNERQKDIGWKKDNYRVLGSNHLSHL